MAQNVAAATGGMMGNSGQTCSVGSRLLVPSARLDEAVAAAKAAAEGVTVGDPKGEFAMGPVVSKAQYDSIQGYIRKGLDEGATLVAGGLGRPDGIDKGWFVRPTVFVGTNDMVVAREEIFGPVLVIIGYDDIDHAVGGNDIQVDVLIAISEFGQDPAEQKRRCIDDHVQSDATGRCVAVTVEILDCLVDRREGLRDRIAQFLARRR